MQSHPCHGCVEACPCPQTWPLPTLSIIFSSGEDIKAQAGRQVPPGPLFPRITTQTPLSLNPSSPRQLLAHSQSLCCHGPKCSVAARRLHLKVWLRGTKARTDAVDLPFRHLLFPPCQGCLHDAFIAMGPGKSHSGASALQGMSLLSLPCSAPYINIFLTFFFSFWYLFFFFLLSHYPFNAEQGC